MNGTELLNEFAKSKGIDVGEVNEFLEKYKNPKTLDDLFNMPNDMLNHIRFISYVENPLKSLIHDELWCERYQTVDLERVVDCLEDRRYYAEKNGDTESLEELLKIEQCLIETKFGSVVYDW